MMIPLKTVQKAIERDAFDEHTDEKKTTHYCESFLESLLM